MGRCGQSALMNRHFVAQQQTAISTASQFNLDTHLHEPKQDVDDSTTAMLGDDLL